MEVNRQKGFSMKFKVGDRVQKINGDFTGEYGKLVTYSLALNSWLVEFDEASCMKHSGGGKYKENHCYWCEPTNLRLVKAPDDTKIEIFRSGKTVIALKRTKGKVVAKGVAKCHPDDEFDFDTGARLAMERCVGKADTATTGKHVGNTKIVKQDRYEVGDKVKIVDKWVSGTQNRLRKMDKWLGKVMTIRGGFSNSHTYWMEEDADENGSYGHGWLWNDKDIEGKVVEDTAPESKSTESEPMVKVGDTVEFRDIFWHRLMPIFFPPMGTKGTVVNAKTNIGRIQVQWEEGSTSGDDCWFVSLEHVRKVSNDPHKFKVGDIVIGNELATERYAITQEGWVGRVTEVSDNGFRAVPSTDDWMTNGYSLEYDYFDKYTVDKK